MFITDDAGLALALPYSHDLWLVAISYLVAVFASFAAFRLVGRVQDSTDLKTRLGWLVTAAVALGTGVWSMHFIAILAVDILAQATFHTELTALSMLFAMLASGAAFHIVGTGTLGWRRTLVGGLILGSGIGAMHYTGMAAMRLAADVRYDPALFALSILVAVALASVTLHLMVRSRSQGAEVKLVGLLGLAGVMGLAIALMHHTGMAAAHYFPQTQLVPLTHQMDPRVMAVIVSLLTFFVIILAMLATISSLTEIWVITTVTLAGFAVFAATGFSETLYDSLIQGRHTTVIELFPTMVVLVGALTIFAFRRAREANRELAERKLAEEALRASEERLKIQVAELRDSKQRQEAQSAELIVLAENLTGVRDNLQQLNDQKDKFFSIIAHDLKGPFNALLGYSSLLSSGIADFNHNKVAEYASAVHESGQRVFRLLENLLEWSQLQMGRLEFEPGPVDLNEIIDANLELFASIAKEKAIRLTGTKGKPLIVFADDHMIDTVVRNLVNNAIKFTPEKGSATISARGNGKWAEVEVSDTGVGMSADKTARLFRLGEKTSTVGTGGETGTGLGLHLCKELVEMQGGQIHVESTEGEGTTFRITLPLFSA